VKRRVDDAVIVPPPSIKCPKTSHYGHIATVTDGGPKASITFIWYVISVLFNFNIVPLRNMTKLVRMHSTHAGWVSSRKGYFELLGRQLKAERGLLE
jgi:hypothetical protein